MTHARSLLIRLSALGMFLAGLLLLAGVFVRPAYAESPRLPPTLQALYDDPLRHALEMAQPIAVERAQRFIREIGRYRAAAGWDRSLIVAQATGQQIEQCNAESVRRGLGRLESRLRELAEVLKFLEGVATRNSEWEQAIGELQRHLAAHAYNWAQAHSAQRAPLRFEPRSSLLPRELDGTPLPPPVEVVDTALAAALEVVIAIPRATWELEANRDALSNFNARDGVLDAWRQVFLLARDEARDLHQRTETYHGSLQRLIDRLRGEFLEHACESQCLTPEEIAELELPPPPEETQPREHPRPTGSATRHAEVERIWSDQ